MNRNAISGHISRSPYEMVNEARNIMSKCILELSRKNEKKILRLINAADSYPDMSKYQLSTARTMLLDLYMSHEIYGNALELCEVILNDYPKAPVKNKLKKLVSIRDQGIELTYSCDINIVDTDLCYQSPSLKNNDFYNEEFEEEIAKRLDNLDPLSKSEFYRNREKRGCNGVLSSKEEDLLTLESMEKAFHYRNKN